MDKVEIKPGCKIHVAELIKMKDGRMNIEELDDDGKAAIKHASFCPDCGDYLEK